MKEASKGPKEKIAQTNKKHINKVLSSEDPKPEKPSETENKENLKQSKQNVQKENVDGCEIQKNKGHWECKSEKNATLKPKQMKLDDQQEFCHPDASAVARVITFNNLKTVLYNFTSIFRRK